MMVLEMEGTRGRGRPRRRLMHSMKEHPKEKGLVGGEFKDREECHSLVRNADPYEKQAIKVFKYKEDTIMKKQH